MVPASRLQRLGSWIADAFVVVVVVGVPSVLIEWWFGPDGGIATTCDFVDTGDRVVERCGAASAEGLRFSRITFWSLACTYLTVYSVRIGRTGTTLGKRSSETQVVDARHGEPIGVRRALVRTVVGTLTTACFGLNQLVALVDPERRGIHDRLVGSRVISP